MAATRWQPIRAGAVCAQARVITQSWTDVHSFLLPSCAQTAPARGTWKPWRGSSMRRRRILPGFNLSLGYSLTYLGLIVLLPLAALAWKASGLGLEGLIRLLRVPRTLAALKLSFGGATLAAAINVVVGLLVAWVLVRYRFPGRPLFDAVVDLPFALRTAVAGIALTALYAPNGWIGQWLAALGLKVAYTPWGVLVAMVFVGFPFVVRTLQPVLETLEHDVEEAAETLGARRWQIFLKVILPMLVPTLLTGFALALARAVG